MTEAPLDFIHRYIPPAPDGEGAAGITLLALHGTGGDESDLIPLAQSILPGAGVLSPRGKVLEGGMPRFFRRLAEGVFDQDDLRARTAELVAFIDGASTTYGFDRASVVAVGFSNGANMAASVLLRNPGVLRGAALFSPMLPFAPDPSPRFTDTSVFIGAGSADPMVPAEQAKRLADVLTGGGAELTVHWHEGGHTITQPELAAAQHWAQSLLPPAE